MNNKVLSSDVGIHINTLLVHLDNESRTIVKHDEIKKEMVPLAIWWMVGKPDKFLSL